MAKLRILVLVVVLCGFGSTAAADDFWTASAPNFATPLFGSPTFVAPTFVTPTYVAPTYVAPAYVAPTYVAPTYVVRECAAPEYVAPDVSVPGVAAPSLGVPYNGYDDYTDLLLLDQLETMNQTLRDIESHMREALHQEAWDRMLGRYRN